jgi:hypothetical protein
MYGNTEKARLMPYLMARVIPYFNFDYSVLAVQKGKEQTSRIAMWRELQERCDILEPNANPVIEKNIGTEDYSEVLTKHNVFTLEASFAGSNSGEHFTARHYSEIGESLLKSIGIYTSLRYRDFLDCDLFRDLIPETNFSEIMPQFRERMIAQENKVYEPKKDEDGYGTSSGSDSNLEEEERAAIFKPAKANQKKDESIVTSPTKSRKGHALKIRKQKRNLMSSKPNFTVQHNQPKKNR